MQVGPPPFSRGAMVRQNRPEGNNEVSTDEREKATGERGHPPIGAPVHAATPPSTAAMMRALTTPRWNPSSQAVASASTRTCQKCSSSRPRPMAEPAMASIEPDAADPRPLSSDDGEPDSLGGRLLHRLRPVAPTEPAAPGRRRGARPCSQHRPATDSSIRSCRAIRGRSGLPGPRPQPR